MRNLLSILLLAAMVSAAGCGGDGDGGGGGGGGAPDPANLAGTWGGTRDDGSTLFTFTVTADSAGQITSVSWGGVNQGLTGTVSGVPNTSNIFEFTLSNGVEGGFLTDSTFTHAYFLDAFLARGALQKGASGWAAGGYIDTDVVGSWSGTFAEVDASFNLTATGTSQATVNSNFTFSGSSSAGETFSGLLTSFNSIAGLYVGTYSNSVGESGPVEVILTPDKQFAGSIACNGFFALDNCGYNMWVK